MFNSSGSQHRFIAPAVVALACVVWAPVSVFAGVAVQPSAEARADLPAAEDIFEHYVEAIGGWDALNSLKNRRISGTYSGQPFEYTARLQVWWERDGRFHQKVVEPGGLRYELFANNGRTWMKIMDKDPMPVLGSRHSEVLDTADFLGEANYHDRYKSIQTVGKAKADGEDVWVVQAITQSGRPHSLFFSVESGLLRGTRVPVTSDKGMREMTVRLFDYVDAGGVLFPSRLEQQFKGDAAINKFDYTSIEVNADDEQDYTVPEAVEKVFAEIEARAEAGGGDAAAASDD